MAEDDRYSRMAELSGTAKADTGTAVEAPAEEGVLKRLIRQWMNNKSVNAAPKTWQELDENGEVKYYRMGANGKKEEVQGRGV